MKHILLTILFATTFSISNYSCMSSVPEHFRDTTKNYITDYMSYITKVVNYNHVAAVYEYIVYYDSLKVDITKINAVRYKNPDKVTMSAVDIFGNPVKLTEQDSLKVVEIAFKSVASCFIRFYPQSYIEDWVPIEPKEAYIIADSIRMLNKQGAEWHKGDRGWRNSEICERYVDSVRKSKDMDSTFPSYLFQVLINGNSYGFRHYAFGESNVVLPKFKTK